MSGRPHRPDIDLAGRWKLACSLAILAGHSALTLGSLPGSAAGWNGLLTALGFFGSRHFFFFSGYFAGPSLANAGKPLLDYSVIRALRLYLLVLAALALGLAARLAFGSFASSSSTWPMTLWAGPMDWSGVLLHLSPLGFAPTNDLNYASWYLYQELRIVLLFPVFRWILGRNMFVASGWATVLLVIAAIGEYLCWSAFPVFRSSPFQTLGYGTVFLAGALVRRHVDARVREPLRGRPRSRGVLFLAVGLVAGYSHQVGLALPISNPPVQNMPVLLGQILVFLGLVDLLPDFRGGAVAGRISRWSTGVYVIHPVVNMVAYPLAAADRPALFLLAMGLSIPVGAVFTECIYDPLRKRLEAGISVVIGTAREPRPAKE